LACCLTAWIEEFWWNIAHVSHYASPENYAVHPSAAALAMIRRWISGSVLIFQNFVNFVDSLRR
jgi:hypothetical protein